MRDLIIHPNRHARVSDYEMWSGPQPGRHVQQLCHREVACAFTNTGGMENRGRMCVSWLVCPRIACLGWPQSVSSTGGILSTSQARQISRNTQQATLDFNGHASRLEHRTYGNAADRTIRGGATIYGDKGTLTTKWMGDDSSADAQPAIHKDVT